MVWDFFSLEVDKDGKAIDDGNAKCRNCHRTVFARNGNTSNLLSHLIAHHPRLFSKVKQLMVGKPTHSSGSKTSPSS